MALSFAPADKASSSGGVGAARPLRARRLNRLPDPLSHGGRDLGLHSHRREHGSPQWCAHRRCWACPEVHIGSEAQVTDWSAEQNCAELAFCGIRCGKCNLRRLGRHHESCSVGAPARLLEGGVEQLHWRPNPLLDCDRPTSRSDTPNFGGPMHTHRRNSSHQDFVTTCDNP